jgi:hypothetical protein
VVVLIRLNRASISITISTPSLRNRFSNTIFLISFYTIKANSLDPDEYLIPETFQWCQQQLAQLNLATPPVASDFIPRLDDFRVPDYYKSLIHTARVYHGSGKEPRLELAAKPRGGYGWNPRHEVAEELAEEDELAEG